MTKKQRGFVVTFGLVATAALAGCGLYGGGGGGTRVDVKGTIAGVLPGDTGRDIVVFVYRVKDEPADCTTPLLPDKGTSYESTTLKDGETTFEVDKSKAGRLVIAFLLDNEGKDADGRIDPGDPVAVLNDPECVLDDVPNKYIAEADDVRINFSLDDQIGYPATGRAEAGVLKEYPRN